MKHYLKNIVFQMIGFFVLVMGISGCTEEISFKTEALESALVVEAIITNELQQHEIVLSRTYAFEEDGPIPENNATVSIESPEGTINFEEITSGRYRSTTSFAAQSDREYILKIRTGDGKQYRSNPTQLTPATPIANLYAEREVNDANEDGMSIFVDSFDPSGNSQFYRFEFEETYKIIAPLWRLEDLVVTDPRDGYCVVEFQNKKEEKRVCYKTDKSNAIIIGNTTALSDDRLQRFPVRRIREDNYIISHRYSILVRQYIQSREAYTYYETLQEFSGQGSIFSQSQPGFFNGNIVAVENPEEKVVGFFEASYVSSQRLFFDYSEFFPGEPLPPYISGCTQFAPEQFTPVGSCGPLITGLLNEEIVYVRPNSNPSPGREGPYMMAATACGDCTVLGSNQIPDFWIE